MYTGITQGLFTVTKVTKTANCITYLVRLNLKLMEGLEIGASVAIDGVCQTVVAINGNEVEFNAAGKTLELTTLNALYEGQLVSVERSAKFGDEIGGHQMAGHVFGVAEVVAREEHEDNLMMTIKAPENAIEYILDKGYVGLDGSSLTVHDVNTEQYTFVINLIPHTLEVTNFKNKKVGDKLNLELDANTVTIVETIKRYMQSKSLN